MIGGGAYGSLHRLCRCSPLPEPRFRIMKRAQMSLEDWKTGLESDRADKYAAVDFKDETFAIPSSQVVSGRMRT